MHAPRMYPSIMVCIKLKVGMSQTMVIGDQLLTHTTKIGLKSFFAGIIFILILSMSVPFFFFLFFFFFYQ